MSLRGQMLFAGLVYDQEQKIDETNNPELQNNSNELLICQGKLTPPEL
jgi:hypothetical protein